MGLRNFLFKTDEHRKLTTLLCVNGLTASVHELSQLSGLPYATAHEFLQRLLSMGLVEKTKSGRATLFSSNLFGEDLKSLKILLGGGKSAKKKPLSEFPELVLPLVGEYPEFEKEKAQSLEELLVKLVVLAKRNSSLLRVLPLLVQRLGDRLDVNELGYWSKRHHVDRELGFVLDLTARLSENRKFSLMAKRLMDKRWSKPTFFLKSEEGARGFQAKLSEQNTPDLAKKWYLKLNMGLDSFESMYGKFA